MDLEAALEQTKEELDVTREERDRHKLHANTYMNKFETLEHYYGEQ